jgi:hypothetical protein
MIRGTLEYEGGSRDIAIYEQLPTTKREVEELVGILTGQYMKEYNFVFPLFNIFGRQIYVMSMAFKDEGILADQSIPRHIFNWAKDYLEPNLPDQWTMGKISEVSSFKGNFPTPGRYFLFFFSFSHFLGEPEFSIQNFKP